MKGNTEKNSKMVNIFYQPFIKQDLLDYNVFLFFFPVQWGGVKSPVIYNIRILHVPCFYAPQIEVK